MANLRVSFGKAVRQLRKERDLSQESFASKAKVGRSYMGKIERGEVNVSVDIIVRIAIALGVTPGALMTAADEQSGSRS